MKNLILLTYTILNSIIAYNTGVLATRESFLLWAVIFLMLMIVLGVLQYKCYKVVDDFNNKVGNYG